jgi:hypothetical protein
MKFEDRARYRAQVKLTHSVRLRPGYRSQSLSLDASLCRYLMLPQFSLSEKQELTRPSVCLTKEKIGTGPAFYVNK